MANMAYFNGINSRISISQYFITPGDWKVAFDVKGAGSLPAEGYYYSVAEPVRINSSGQIYVTAQTDVVGTTNVLTDGLVHHVEVTIIGTTASIYIDGNATAEASGTVESSPDSIAGLSYLQEPDNLFKGFISNYKVYSGTSLTLVWDMPLTADFLDHVGVLSGTGIRPEHVIRFDADNWPFAAQAALNPDCPAGSYLIAGDYYHYWCSETTIGSGYTVVGSGAVTNVYQTKYGCVFNFSLPETIPQNSKITEAYLIFAGMTDRNNSDPSGEGACSRITGWKTASPSTMTSWSDYARIRGTITDSADNSNLTDAQVEMDGAVIHDGDMYTGPSIVSIIQEIVSLGNISNISLFWDDHEQRSVPGKGYIVDVFPILVVKYDSTEYNCSLTYDANGGTGTVPTGSIGITHSTSVAVAGNIGGLTKAGFDFVGWTTHEDGTGTVYEGDDLYTIEANTVLYAKWCAPLTVTYNANDADSGMPPSDTGKYYAGYTDTVLVRDNAGPNRLIKAQHTFRSWNTAADGSGVTYLPGSTLKITNSVTLYAIWDIAITSEEVNGGVQVGRDENAQFRGLPIPKAAENQLVGNYYEEYVERLGYSIRFVLSSPIPRNATILSASLKGVGGMGITGTPNPPETETTTSCFIHAQSNPAPTAITNATDYQNRFTGQITSASVEFSGQTITEGVAFTTPSLVSILDELVKLGDVSSILFFIEDHYGNSGGGHFYSIAQPMELNYSYECSISYNGNGYTGGSVPVDSTTYTSNDNVIVANPGTMSRTGYSFVKWNTSADGTGTDYVPGNNFNIMADMVLYAQWRVEAPVSITYNGNGNTGGTEPIDSRSYIYGTTATVLGNIGSLVKTGYTFSKWNTAADGSGTDYIPGNSFTVTANTTLYAQWTIAVAKVVTIVAWDTINDRGRTGDAANITVRGVRDGVEYAPVAASVTEVDAADMPGIYTVSLTESENDCYFNTVGGRSSSAGVVIKPTFWRNEEEQKCCCVCCCKKC